ncbi:MAG: nitroreductase/quinone reductase family protein [Chloroflexi bacterium]|nr:nitroreductase/quinone reductase family protein [Chloroflexota bacterium]
MSQTPSIPPYVNSMMKFMLRSPLHGLVSKSILLITFKGRRSGKSFTTPVSYSQHDGQVTIFTHAGWWKNLDGHAPVELRLQGRDVQAMATPVAVDKQAVAAGLIEHLRKVPSDARYYGVAFDDRKNPQPEDVEKASQSVVMINVSLC